MQQGPPASLMAHILQRSGHLSNAAGLGSCSRHGSSQFKEELLAQDDPSPAGPEAGPQLTEDDLVAWFQRKCRPDKKLRIGLEHEKFLVHPDTCKRATSVEVQAVMIGLVEKFGWEPMMEGELVVGVRKDGQVVDYEPGGQLELSGAPVDSVWEVEAQEGQHLQELREVLRELGLVVLSTGYDPHSKLEDVELMPKERCPAFWDLLPSRGATGHYIMLNSASVQVSLDFLNEEDMVRKLRVGLGLQPVAVALTSCSPFMEGHPSGVLCTRGLYWKDVDPARTGHLPFVFEEGMGFRRYVQYIMDVPLLWVQRGGHLVRCCGQSWHDFMRGELPALPGEYPTMKDWHMHMSTLFPVVRVKGVVEMRGADAGPPEMVPAVAAFWVGLLYSERVLAAAEELVCSWSQEDRAYLDKEVLFKGLRTPFKEGTLLDVAKQAVGWAREGLLERGLGEEVFLKPLERVVAAGKSLADQMLEDFEGEWGESVVPQYGKGSKLVCCAGED